MVLIVEWTSSGAKMLVLILAILVKWFWFLFVLSLLKCKSVSIEMQGNWFFFLLLLSFFFLFLFFSFYFFFFFVLFYMYVYWGCKPKQALLRAICLFCCIIYINKPIFLSLSKTFWFQLQVLLFLFNSTGYIHLSKNCNKKNKQINV